MLKSITRRSKHTPKHSPALIESLEDRRHLSTTLRLSSITADNRGEVVLAFNRAIRSSAVSASSCIIYTPGADKKIGTKDDVRIHAAVTLDSTRTKVTIHGRLDLTHTGDLGYRVRLISTKLLASNGTELDGEFNGGAKLTGNGKAGGDTNFEVVAPKGNPTARFSTSEGVIKVTLYKDKVATTVNNFIQYVNHAYYDNTIIHRSVSNFIIQGGGYAASLDVNNLPSPITTFLPIALQAGISNTTGTIAMARTSDPNSATSQWFFNTTDNTQLDKTTGSAGYAVFGKTDPNGVAVILTINQLTTSNLAPSTPNTAFGTVPESNGKFVVVRRVSLVDTVAALK